MRDAGTRSANLAAAFAAVAALVVIGTLEAAESARQIADLSTITRLRPAGAGLTALGVAASTLVYLALGWWARDDGVALRLGGLVGGAAGLVGGALRALLISGPVDALVARYAAVPDWFVPGLLGLFVVLCTVVGLAAGAALAIAGVRVSRAARSRPRA